jgi:hypothetical protein
MMKRRWVGCAVVVVIGLLGSAPQASAQGFDLVSVGARSEAMGGAGIAASEDTSALFHNPAALVTLKRPQVDLTLRKLRDWHKENDGYYWDRGTSYSHNAVNQLGYAHPLQVGGHPLVLGIAYQRPMELVTHYMGGKVGGGVATYSPGAAFAIKPWFSAGVAVNVWEGKRDQTLTADEVGMSWRSKYSGFNATVGLLFDLRETESGFPLRVGLTARTPFTLDIDYTDRVRPEGGEEVNSAYSYEVGMPWMVGLGLAADLFSNFTLSAEIEHRFYNDGEIKVSGPHGNDIGPISETVDDVMPLRYGAELRLQFGDWMVPVRAGYRTVPTLRSHYWDHQPVGQVKGDAFTLGTGFGTNRWRADLTYSRSFYDQRDWYSGLQPKVRRTIENYMFGFSYLFGSR